MGLFGGDKKKDPKDAVKEWQSKLRKEGRGLDRQIRGIQREEEKAKRSLKDAAKKGDRDVCVILGKEIVRSRKAVSKIHTAKAQIKSIEYSMTQQLATIRVSGALEKSTEVMKNMQSLVKVPEVMATMREMSKEMMKMGIVEEMLEDTMEGLDDGEELEDEAQEEVDKILWELTAGKIGEAPDAVTESLPVREPEGATADVSSEEEVEDMRARLEALRS